MKEQKTKLSEELTDFIDRSPSAYHAVYNICGILESHGFERLCETDEWKLVSGRGYYITKNGSSVIAFRVPGEDITGFNITASHSDAPTFKLKENCEKTGGEYVRINTEKYGGMICASWLDRPLGYAGRVVISTDDGIETRLVASERDMFIIPNVAIHMKRDINDAMKFNPAVDTVPLYSTAAMHKPFLEEVAECAGVSTGDIISHDLYLYNRQKGSIWGNGGEFISARSLDDLACAFSSLTGFLGAGASSAVPVFSCFDNEEVGSSTKQGAASVFLCDTLERIAEACGKKLSALIPSSFMLSCDNAHAIHPNYPELSDRENSVKLNGGVVIKYNAQQKYTTDAVSSSVVKLICKKCGVPYQQYANRSDIAGGSTLGGIASTKVPVSSADIGIAQLAMHSAYETAGAYDTEHMARLCREFFGTAVICERDGKYRLQQ